MTDPYRTGFDLVCPVCAGALLLGETAVCPAGCGEWFEPGELADGVGMAWPGRGGPCARCKQRMEYLSKDDLVVERCKNHGVWIAATSRHPFQMWLADQPRRQAVEAAARSAARERHAAEEAEIARVVAAISDPRELARRIVALERAIAELRTRVTD